MCVYIYIYIYIYREREREREWVGGSGEKNENSKKENNNNALVKSNWPLDTTKAPIESDLDHTSKCNMCHTSHMSIYIKIKLDWKLELRWLTKVINTNDWKLG